MERTDPQQSSDERTMLTEFLDHHRATLVTKATGLSQTQMATNLEPSTLTLAGLVKHMALVEHWWFVQQLMGLPPSEPWAGAPFDADPDWELHSAVDDEPAELLGLYTAACERSRSIVEGADSLDTLSRGLSDRTGQPFSLRWILVHMIEETARHNGHADLIRESIDGTTGQ